MGAQGSVIARVYTSDAYLPLRNVPVIFTQTDSDGSQILLAIRFTDSSGLTTLLYVDTPGTEDSLAPGSALRPYTTVDIRTAFPGYNSITALRVQIFPGIETIQDLQLRPVSEANADSQVIFPGSSQNL